MQVYLALESGAREQIKLKVGSYTFRLKLVDLPYEFVDVYKCINDKCKCIHFDETDQYGVFIFDDNISGLSTITYRIVNNGRVFGEIAVMPVLIDANDILSKATSLLETLLVSRRILY